MKKFVNFLLSVLQIGVAAIAFLILNPQNATIHELPAESILKVHYESECVVGQLVRFDARDNDADNIIWSILPSTPDFEVSDGGRRAMLSSRTQGEYIVVGAGAKGGVPMIFQVKVTFKDSSFSSIHSLDQKIASWVQDIKSEKKAEEAAKISGVFRTLSTTDIEVDKILDATAAANRAALGESLQTWVPFLEHLGNELDVYVDSDQLATKEQYSSLWLKIADAIDKSSK